MIPSYFERLVCILLLLYDFEAKKTGGKPPASLYVNRL